MEFNGSTKSLSPLSAAIGDPVVTGVYGSFANHYSLLRTLEDAYGITTHLGGAASAGTLGNIWGP